MFKEFIREFKFKRVVSVLLVLGLLAFVMYVALRQDKGYYINANGDKVGLCKEFSLIDITNICYDTKDFSVISQYVTLSGLPEGDNVIEWEIGSNQELSSVDSNMGTLEYDYIDDVAYIKVDDGIKDIQLVFYIKTTDLQKSLNQVINLNKDAIIANDFGYAVILPDGTIEELPKRLSEGNKVTLKEYFVWVNELQ